MNRTLWENHNCNILLFLCNVSLSSSGITVKLINRVSECLRLVAHNFSLVLSVHLCTQFSCWRSCYTSWLIFNQSGYYQHHNDKNNNQHDNNHYKGNHVQATSSPLCWRCPLFLPWSSSLFRWLKDSKICRSRSQWQTDPIPTIILTSPAGQPNHSTSCWSVPGSAAPANLAGEKQTHK